MPLSRFFINDIGVLRISFFMVFEMGQNYSVMPFKFHIVNKSICYLGFYSAMPMMLDTNAALALRLK